jgi:hypothetical protein
MQHRSSTVLHSMPTVCLFLRTLTHKSAYILFGHATRFVTVLYPVSVAVFLTSHILLAMVYGIHICAHISGVHPEFFCWGADPEAIYNLCSILKIML